MFWSVLDTWNSVMTLPTDVKELIPEFYSDPSFLINSEKLNFGERAAGTALSLNTPPAGHTHTSGHVGYPQLVIYHRSINLSHMFGWLPTA